MAVLLLVAASASAAAGEFRHIRPIPVAPAGERAAAAPVRALVPVDRRLVERAVHDIAAAWNTGELERHLAEDFYDRERLTDAIDRVVPRDATVRVLAVQGMQTLTQSIEARGGRRERVSLVSVTVSTQVEFNGPAGFARIPGTTELIVRVREPLQ